MRVGFSTVNQVACQPLKFGQVKSAPNQNTSKTPAQYEKELKDTNARLNLACHILVAQADQYNKYVAANPCKASK